MWTKLNRFLRGEAWLHMATMFLILTSIYDICQSFGYVLPLWLSVIIILAAAVGWELLGKLYEQKFINLSDMIATAAGGALALIINQYIYLL